MRDLERSRDDAALDRARAKEAEERARKMLESMSPEQREELERWARNEMRERAPESPPAPGAAPWESESVDARRPGEGGSVVGEVEAGEDAPPPDASVVSRDEFVEQLEGSLESAERAMEDRVVPARYTNVQRYFQQALERLEREKAAGSGAGADGPIVPAEDVGAGSPSGDPKPE